MHRQKKPGFSKIYTLKIPRKRWEKSVKAGDIDIRLSSSA